MATDAQQPTMMEQTKQTIAELSAKVADTLNVSEGAAAEKGQDAPSGGE
jgi:hypothetical protein